MAREIIATSPSGTLYTRLFGPTGLWWNGTTFEAYTEANYTDYDIAMTEQGTSGVYVADFPSAITTAGTYLYFVHRQAGATPAAGDLVVNSGKIDWTGTNSVTVTASTGAMTGEEWQAYILRKGFKRTDKDSELYEATTDAIQEMRRRFSFDEAQEDSTSTDTISTLGDYKLAIETDLGLLAGIIIQDDGIGTPLEKISKARYDELYPDAAVTDDRGYPKHYTVFAQQVYLGPIPDSTDYTYRKSFSLRAGTITSATAGVPFTNLYRDVLAELTLCHLYAAMQEEEQSDIHRNRFENGFLLATRRERLNRGEGAFCMVPRDC